jgi:hypothetical protein
MRQYLFIKPNGTESESTEAEGKKEVFPAGEMGTSVNTNAKPGVQAYTRS